MQGFGIGVVMGPTVGASMRMGRFGRRISVVLGTACVVTAAVLPVVPARAAGASSAPVPPPVIYTPPTAVNRTPTGSTPSGSYAPTTGSRSGTSGSGSGASAASQGVSPNAAPVGTSAGAAGLGVLGGVGLESFPLESSLTAQVNVGNGNLLITGGDLHLNGPGIALNLSRFYNGLSSGNGAFGAGWTMSTGRDVGLVVAGNGSVTFTGPSGFQVTYVPNGSGGYVMPANINADLTHTGSTYTVTYRGSGEKLTFSSGGFLTSDADHNGNTLTLAYNADNTLASVTDAAGRVTTFQYNGPGGGSGRVTTYTDPGGRRWTYGYDGNGNLTSTRDNDGHTTNYSYDSSNRLTQVVTAANHIMAIGYDSSYRVTSVTRYVNGTSGPSSVTGFAYPSSTQTVETNPDGKTYTFNLDSSARPTSVTDPLGHMRSQTFTANGDVSSAVDAMGAGSNPGNATTYSYDSANNPTGATTPTGAADTAQYGSSSTCASTDTTHPYLAKCSTDAEGDSSQAWYDTAGNTMKVADTTGGTTTGASSTATYQGDPAASGGTVNCGGHPGQICSSTTPNGGTTTFGYNSNGDRTSVTPPSPLGAETLAYDSLSRLTSVTDGKGQQTTYAYNSEDAETYTTWAGADNDQSTYDNDGNLTQQNDNRNGGDSYAYDGLGRQTGFSETGTNALSTVTYDPAGNVLTNTDGTGTTTYTYDAANELTSLAEPGTSSCTAGAYGSAGCTYYIYDPDGHVLQTIYPGYTVQTASYDNSGRITHIKATYGSTTLSDLGYSYTASTAGPTGSMDRELTQSRTDNLGVGGPMGSTINYVYDDQQRLHAATEKTSTGTTNASWYYFYDVDGNRTTTSSLLNGTTTNSSYGYNAVDELTSINGSTAGLAYDADGNETANPGTPSLGIGSRTDTVNSRNQVTNITTGGTTSTPFTYLGGGNTERLTVGNPSQAGGLTTVNTLLGVGSQTPPSGPTTAFTRTPAGGLVSMRTGGNSYYYLTDALGSVVGLVTTTGTKAAAYAYDPFGVTRTSTGTQAAANPFRYTSGYQDPTGLYHLGARYYDPSTGRFTQLDPTGQSAGYSYAAGEPIDFSDPSGESLFGDIAKGVGIAAGVAAVFATGGTAAILVGVATAADVSSGVANGDSAKGIAVGAGLDLVAGGEGYGAEKALEVGEGATSAAIRSARNTRYAVNSLYAGTSIGGGYGILHSEQ